MAWPPTQGTSTFIARGSAISTLAWGTDGLIANTTIGASTTTNISGAIVKSMRPTQMVSEVPIENGTGLTAVSVNLIDGDQIELVCEDDRDITWPSYMSIITLYNPRVTGAVAFTAFQVMSNDYNTGRKQNGERTLLLKRYTLITPSATSGT